MDSLTPDEARLYAEWFGGLADPTRLGLLAVLARQTEPMSVGELATHAGLAQSTVSHHLRVLAGARYVFLSSEGTRTRCTVNQRCLEALPAAGRRVLGIAPAAPSVLASDVSQLVVIRHAAAGERPVLTQLLASAGLPLAGFASDPTTTLVAELDGSVVGCVALERYGKHALLRSLVVAPGHRGDGTGRRLVDEATGLAARMKLSDLYLLTDTVPEFFERLGWQPVRREEMPAGVAASVEVREACSLSAAAYHLSLPKLADVTG
jgi:N-acetylglutamate synthase-like GNAT family acetyltransferase